MLIIVDSASGTSEAIKVTPVVDHVDLRKWMIRLNLSYDTAAEVLGIHRSTFATMLNGVSRETKRPLPLPRSVQLAAMAIEIGIDRLLPPPEVRRKSRRSGFAVQDTADRQSEQALQAAIEQQSAAPA